MTKFVLLPDPASACTSSDLVLLFFISSLHVVARLPGPSDGDFVDVPLVVDGLTGRLSLWPTVSMTPALHQVLARLESIAMGGAASGLVATVSMLLQLAAA
jgi:hypothetical protein